jgi:hypothetical protein
VRAIGGHHSLLLIVLYAQELVGGVKKSVDKEKKQVKGKKGKLLKISGSFNS